MTLTLRAVALNHTDLTQPITAHFDGHGGTIGRSDQNTMALPDPERIISRHHAQIDASGPGYVITNIGSANPIVVRNQLLARGESTPLAPGDSVRIGGYLLEVLGDDAPTRLGAPPPVVAPQRPDTPAPLAADNPFAEWLAPAPPAPPAAPAASAASMRSVPSGAPAQPCTAAPLPPPQADTAPRLPADFDLLKRRRAPAPLPSAPEDTVPDTPPRDIDELIGVAHEDALTPLDHFLADAPRRAPSAPPPVGPDSALADRVPELRASWQPPRPLPTLPTLPPLASRRPSPPLRPPPSPAAAASAPAPRAPAGPVGDPAEARLLWAAFCRGAGIEVEAAGDHSTPRMLETAGTLLRLATKGALQLIALRSSTRYELHAPVTMIRPAHNNPLKFSPNERAALETLLKPPVPGFLPGPVAMADAMNDLLGHAIGTMAGTRAALEGVLGRFAPAELEAKLSGNGMLDRLLPMARKARLWELYLEHHRAIRDEAQEDFHTLFGKAFLAAYEQQLERLRHEREPAPADAPGHAELP